MSDAMLRRFLRAVPNKSLRQIMEISSTMHQRSQEIIDEKKAALAKGDAGLAHEVGEGKDIMSICRTCARAECEVRPADQRGASRSAGEHGRGR